MKRPTPTEPASTLEKAYAERLVRKSTIWWKRILDVQAPYRWNLRRIKPGFVLEIGCGIGRNLVHLEGYGVGVDHNKHAIEIARSRGCQAYTTDEFEDSPHNCPETFDSLLLAHVAEHMTGAQATSLLRAYVPLLKTNGRIVVITPQERGFASDASHIEFTDWEKIRAIVTPLGFAPETEYSFPLPRWFGKIFPHNEFVSISHPNAPAAT